MNNTQHYLNDYPTFFSRRESFHCFKLYDTVILRYNDNTIHLNHGKFKTALTKRRMNEISSNHGLELKVYAKNGLWYCLYNGTNYQFETSGNLKINR